MEDTIAKMKQQHFTTYKNAIIDSIKNNTNVLVEEDLKSLIKKPPLDSMDLIKSKFLDLAKKSKIILDTENLDEILDSYRASMIKCCSKVKKLRIEELTSVVECDDEQVIKILKKDFNALNKKITKIIKEQLDTSIEKFISKIDCVFNEYEPTDVRNKITKDMIKYINTTYKKGFLENVDIKILIKDTTLMNLVKEQTERYLFTLNNSRLFKDNI